MSGETVAVSLVVPVFGDGAALPGLVDRAAAVFDGTALSWEMILVNDGSPVESWSAIQRLAKATPHVRGIDLQRNFGQHNAVLAGIRASRGRVVVTLDDDLQHPPEEVPRLLAALAEGFDVVYGVPIVRPHGVWRNASSSLVKAAMKSVLGAHVAPDIGPFRAFRRELRRSFSEYRSPDVNIDVLLGWATTRIGAVKVRHDPRRHGESQYTFWQLVRHTMNMVTGFSVWPLRLASVIGFGFTCFGGVLLVFVIGRYLLAGGSVPGFPFLASVIVLFAGAQLFALRIIGEYLARMYFRTMDRSPYVIDATVNDPED